MSSAIFSKKHRKNELVSRPDPTHVEREGNDVGEAGDPLIERFLKVVLGYLGQQGLQGGVVGKRHQQDFPVAGSAKDLVEKLAKPLQDFLLPQTPFPVVEEHLLVAYSSLLKVHCVVQGGKGPLCNWVCNRMSSKIKACFYLLLQTTVQFGYDSVPNQLLVLSECSLAMP